MADISCLIENFHRLLWFGCWFKFIFTFPLITAWTTMTWAARCTSWISPGNGCPNPPGSNHTRSPWFHSMLMIVVDFHSINSPLCPPVTGRWLMVIMVPLLIYSSSRWDRSQKQTHEENGENGKTIKPFGNGQRVTKYFNHFRLIWFNVNQVGETLLNCGHWPTE